ncbi:MAG: hypothetical protein SOZ00_02645, partial [Tidjanibacter sp.]|nr:hypothetical protein [Tidjanibacter sp.]
YLGTYAVIDFDCKVTNSSPLTHKLTSKRLYFNCFKEQLDYFNGTAMIPIKTNYRKGATLKIKKLGGFLAVRKPSPMLLAKRLLSIRSLRTRTVSKSTESKREQAFLAGCLSLILNTLVLKQLKASSTAKILSNI